MKASRLAERLRDQGLPGLAIDCVSGSLRKARLRGRQEEEVARELAAHFEDGIASGRRLEHLVRDFGDPVFAGALIGRGVRRRMHAGRYALRLAQTFALLVLAAYLVSFARLNAGPPQIDVAPAGEGARGEALLPWSLAEPSLAAALSRGRELVADARREARIGKTSGAAERLLGALGAARDIARGPFPAHGLAALRLAGEAAAAAELLRTDPSSLAALDASGIAELWEATRTGEIAWSPPKVRTAFHALLSSMYTHGDSGRLTAKGLRIFQAWKGKTDPSLAAFLLEPAYFSHPAGRGEVIREFDRLLALAASDPWDRAFEREKELLDSSSWRSLCLVSLAIPLSHLAATREASRALEAASPSSRGRF